MGGCSLFFLGGGWGGGLRVAGVTELNKHEICMLEVTGQHEDQVSCGLVLRGITRYLHASNHRADAAAPKPSQSLGMCVWAVSYTHLTLPTRRTV